MKHVLTSAQDLSEHKNSRRVRTGWLIAAALCLFAANQDAKAALVGLWQFNEGTDQVIADSSGNGLNGFLGTSASDTVRDPLWSTTGSTVGAGGGNALAFPSGAIDDYGRVNNTALLTPLSAVTLAVDFDPDSFTQGVLVSKHSGTTSGSYMLSITGGNFQFMIVNATPTRVNLSWPIPAGDETTGYHQLVGTYDGTTMRMYYDGILRAQVAQSGNLRVVTAPLLFGEFNQANTGWEYEGLLDNVALFDTALGDGGIAIEQPAAEGSEIYQLFHQGAASFRPAMIITTQPTNQIVALGASATFSVGISGGTQPLHYQWQANSVNINGATSNPFVLTNAQRSDSAYYTVIVTDATSLSVTSQPAFLIASPIGHQLVGLWQFNEGSGQMLADSSGNGLDGFLGNSLTDTVRDPVWSANGKSGSSGDNALSFLGSTIGDYGRVNDNPLLTPFAAMSLVADIDPNSFYPGVMVSKHTTGSSGSYMLDTSPDGANYRFTVINSSSTRVDLDWPIPAGDEANGYHQLAGTYDGATMRMYYDGSLRATASQSGTLKVTTAPLLFGDFNQPDNVGYEYDGLLDNVALFSTALSDGGVAVGESALAGSDIYKLFQEGAVTFAPVRITATFIRPSTLSLNWSGTNVLESATGLSGPWTAITTNRGPYSVDVTVPSQKFFRLRSE